MKFTKPGVTGNGDPTINPVRDKSNNARQEKKLDSGNYGPDQKPQMTHTNEGPTSLNKPQASSALWLQIARLSISQRKS